jgi:hypothetical protein
MVSSPIPTGAPSPISPTSPISPAGGRAGVLRRAWVRLAGEADPIERQLAATAREGAALARIAHLCAFLMLLLFSLGSLVALAGDSVQAIVSGHITIPALIAAGVSTLLVACMDTSMLLAASMLRLLAARNAPRKDGRLHRFVLGGVALLEASTYLYMSAVYEHPSGLAWALIVARALAAPFLSVYLALARPLPVTARDMLALGERIAGEGVLRDLARIAGDASAPLADKVALYVAAALIAPQDETRLRALLDVAQRRVSPPANASGGTISNSQLTTPGAPETPSSAPAEIPEPPQPPTKSRGKGGVRTPSKGRGKGAKVVRLRTASVEDKARAHWQPGMSVAALEKAAGISRPSAQKYHAMLSAEAAAAQPSAQQVAQ